MVKAAKPYLSRRVVRLLRKVQAHIREEPQRFDMGTWIASGADIGSVSDRHPPCGTVACIGGWMQLLDEPLFRFLYHNDETPSRKALGDALSDLFNNFTGPKPKKGIWVGERALLGDPTRQAETACRVIDRFIERYSASAKGAA
jgi:hypothetical protein